VGAMPEMCSTHLKQLATNLRNVIYRFSYFDEEERKHFIAYMKSGEGLSQ